MTSWAQVGLSRSLIRVPPARHNGSIESGCCRRPPDPDRFGVINSGTFMNRILIAFYLVFSLTAPAFSEEGEPPVRIGIIGLVHTHVRGFLPNALTNTQVQVVGIVEPDQA